MTNIVKRLRGIDEQNQSLDNEAADVIERLRDALEGLLWYEQLATEDKPKYAGYLREAELALEKCKQD